MLGTRDLERLWSANYHGKKLHYELLSCYMVSTRSLFINPCRNPGYFNKLLVAYNIQTPLNLFVVYGSQLFLNFQVMAHPSLLSSLFWLLYII